jgi:hypothetical protein
MSLEAQPRAEGTWKQGLTASFWGLFILTAASTFMIGIGAVLWGAAWMVGLV